MSGIDESVYAEAAHWHLASARDDMDWDRFTDWLDSDRAHRTAYGEIALADAALVEHRAVLGLLPGSHRAEKAERRKVRHWPLWTGGALAAGLAALLLVPRLTAPAPRIFSSGNTLVTLALSDGSKIVLGPHSQLTVSGRHSEQIALQGGAYFAIRHDPARNLTIRAGELDIIDIGTRFEVQTNGPAVRVQVAEGQVELSGQALGQPVELPAGRRILYDPPHGLATVAPVSPSDVGEWREGRLTFDGAPLSLVAADLGRYAGVSVTMPEALGARRFSGTLSIHDGDSAVRDLAQLMGLDLSRRGSAYRLGGPG